MTLTAKEEKVYNVGSEESEISITHLAELIGTTASQHGWTGGIKYVESPEKDFLTNNPQRRLPSTQKIREELGWSATTSLSTGVLRTLAHFKETKN
jgi:UDP-glucuronate decarboxylase